MHFPNVISDGDIQWMVINVVGPSLHSLVILSCNAALLGVLVQFQVFNLVASCLKKILKPNLKLTY